MEMHIFIPGSNKMANNKKGSSFAILLLVLFCLLLVVTTLFYIVIDENNIYKRIHKGFILDDVYAREQLVNFYTQDLLEKTAAEGFAGKENLASKLALNIEKYKVTEYFYGEEAVIEYEEGVYVISELEQLETQFNKIVIYDNRVEWPVEITIKSRESAKDVLSVEYTYEKIFSARR